jgi:PhzF family phenazine biosynthesis protein
VETLRYAAFSSDPAGGNPAGVVLDAAGATDAEKLAVAAEIGYSETAFLVRREHNDFDVRYFSPRAEVPFCGHATIAAGAALAERDGGGSYTFRTQAGPVAVVAHAGPRGASATLTSVPPTVDLLADDDLSALLSALRWEAAELSPQLPPRVAYAGAYHPILAVRTRARLSALDYDFDALGALMAARDWTTVDLIWREAATSFHARNPFPPGGVVEDPATGAAAAAFGGYLRRLGLIDVPASITIEQGYDLGRPSRIDVDIPADEALGISVSGAVVAIPAAPAA